MDERMRVISHRGNMNGPGSQCERERVLEALDAGYDVEIDVRDVNGVLMVGHDEPLYTLPAVWTLKPISSQMWFHAKDDVAREMLRSFRVNSFTHEDEPMASVQPGMHAWWHPNKNATMLDVFDNLVNFILLDIDGHPRLDKERILSYDIAKRPLAICTDWPNMWR